MVNTGELEKEAEGMPEDRRKNIINVITKSKELVLTYDLSETFFPDAEDVELVQRPGHEYMMGRLPTGEYVVKSITYFGGYDVPLIVIGTSLGILRKQHGISREKAYAEDDHR